MISHRLGKRSELSYVASEMQIINKNKKKISSASRNTFWKYKKGGEINALDHSRHTYLLGSVLHLTEQLGWILKLGLIMADFLKHPGTGKLSPAFLVPFFCLLGKAACCGTALPLWAGWMGVLIQWSLPRDQRICCPWAELKLSVLLGS